MKKQTKKIAYRLCIGLGIGLLVTAAVALAIWQWNIHAWEQKAQGYVSTITAQIPAPQNATPEERRDNTMPVLCIDGKDFVGILEMPRYGSVLPVSADWGNASANPRRFDGSVYDRTVQIGATTQVGQYNFYREISVGDSVFFTDMEGNRFSYGITDIHYAKHADQTALQRENAALTLFIKNIYSFEYIILFCN